MLALSAITLAILAFAAILFFTVSRRSKRLLLPLVELLDQQSSEPARSYTLDGDALNGHYGGRSVQFSLAVPDSEEARYAFHITLSSNIPWAFDVAKRSRLGLSSNPNR